MSPKVKNILEWVYCIVIAVVLALLVRYYLGTPTIVKQPSMKDTLLPNERLILNRWPRTIKGKYNRGDIITFEAPSNNSISMYNVNFDNPVAEYDYEPKGFWNKFVYKVLEFTKISYIKRVIGIEGDHVLIKDDKVFLNDKELEEPYVKAGAKTIGNNYADVIVPKGYVFVMGDNRENSADSRVFGCIPVDRIESKVWIRFWPLNKFGKIK